MGRTKKIAMNKSVLYALFVVGVVCSDSSYQYFEALKSEAAILAARAAKTGDAVATLDRIDSLATSFVKRVVKSTSKPGLLATVKTEYCQKAVVGNKVGELEKPEDATADKAGVKPAGCCVIDLMMNTTAATAGKAAADQVEECKKKPQTGDPCTADLDQCNGKRCIDKYEDCGLGSGSKTCVPNDVDPVNDEKPSDSLVAGTCRPYAASGFHGTCVDNYDCMFTGSHKMWNLMGECKNGRCSVDSRMKEGTPCGADAESVKIKAWGKEVEVDSSTALNCGSGLTCKANKDGKHSCQPFKHIGADCTVAEEPSLYMPGATILTSNCDSKLVCDAKQAKGEKGKCAIGQLKKPNDLAYNTLMCDYRTSAGTTTDDKCPEYPSDEDTATWRAKQMEFTPNTACDTSQTKTPTNEDNVCGYHTCDCDPTKGEYNCKQAMLSSCILQSLQMPDIEVEVASSNCKSMFPVGQEERTSAKVATVNLTSHTMCSHLWAYRPFIAAGVYFATGKDTACSADAGISSALNMNGYSRFYWPLGNYTSAAPTCSGKWYGGVNYPRENMVDKPSEFDDVWNSKPEVTGVNNQMYQTVNITLADAFKDIGPLHNTTLGLAVGQQLAIGLNMDGGSQPTGEGTWFDFYKDKDGKYDLVVKQSNQIQCYSMGGDAVITCKILALNGEGSVFNSVDKIVAALEDAINNETSPIHYGFDTIGYIQPNSMTFPTGTGMLPMLVVCIIFALLFVVIVVVILCCVCKGKGCCKKKETVKDVQTPSSS